MMNSSNFRIRFLKAACLVTAIFVSGCNKSSDSQSASSAGQTENTSSQTETNATPLTSAWDGSKIVQHGFTENATRSANNHQLSIQSNRNGSQWIGAYIDGLKPNTYYLLDVSGLDYQGEWSTQGDSIAIEENRSYQVKSNALGRILIESRSGTTVDYFQANLLVTETSGYPLPTYDVTEETIQQVKEWQAPQALINLESDFNNQLATFNGRVYVVWIGPDDRPRIASYPEDGSSPAQEAFISTNPDYTAQHNDAHHTFSIGIDRDGYIHIVGDMHHHPISNTEHLPAEFLDSKTMYWVSDQPEDISRFSFKGFDDNHNLNADGWSYAYFSYDRNMKMYLAGRVRSTNIGSWSPGVIGLAIESYDEKTQSWTALGADTPVSPRNKTVIWAQAGANGTGYQALKSDIFFDLDNRMHIVAAINADNSYNSDYGEAKSSTHILYAYSDDGGQSFHRYDNSLVDLPMTPAAGMTQPTVVVNRQWLGMMPSVGVLSNGVPWVTYEESVSAVRDRKLTILNQPISLSNEYSFSNSVDYPELTKQYVDKYGVVTLAAGGVFVRFQDPDGPWAVHEGLNANHHFDRRLIMETGEIRYSYWTNPDRSTLAVSRLVITPDD